MWLIKRYARKSIYHGCMVWIDTYNVQAGEDVIPAVCRASDL